MKKMKTKKIWAISIVVLLMCGGIMTTGAFSGTTDNNKSSSAVVFENLKFGSSPTQVKIVDAQNQRNLFDTFGIEEPEKVDLPDIRTFDEAGDTINQIIDVAGLKFFEGQIIGILEYADIKILLIDQGDTILEVTWDESTISTYTLMPELLGSKEYSIHVNHSEKGVIGHKEGIELHKLEVQITSSSDAGVLTYYIVTVWREDWWEFLGDKNLLHTEGDFYVDYGNEVENILDHSYTETALGFDRCTFDHSTTGAGTIVGEVDTYALWALDSCVAVTKCDQDAWVSCDCWCNADGDGYGDKWIAIGCGCYAYP